MIKKCCQSWIERNPGWEVRILDKDTFSQYVSIPGITNCSRKDLGPAHIADIVRINLIAQYGGVWIDATCFCNVPLDHWIDRHTASGFFAYRGHRKDTPMSNWFMASHPDCYLTCSIRDTVNDFWKSNSYPETYKGKRYRILKLLLNCCPYTTRFWLSYPVRKLLKVRPYFWFHYMFGKLLSDDPRFKRIWKNTPVIEANAPHTLQKFGLLSPVTEELKCRIASKTDYVYKLTWKLHKQQDRYDANNYPEDSALGYLLRTVKNQPSNP